MSVESYAESARHFARQFIGLLARPTKACRRPHTHYLQKIKREEKSLRIPLEGKILNLSSSYLLLFGDKVMTNESTIDKITELVTQYQRLGHEYKKTAAEPKAEEYVLELLQILGWKTLGEEVIPQKKIKRVASSDRVDYSLKLIGSMKPSMYVEVKKFARDL